MTLAITAIGTIATRSQVSRFQETRIPTASRSVAGKREAECLDGAAEVRRWFRLDLQVALARRMRQGEAPGMQMQAPSVRHRRKQRFLAAVLAIAQNRT